MENGPERKVVFGMKIGADSWDDLFHEINQIIFELRTKEEQVSQNISISGGYSSGGTYAFKINPNQTHSDYFAQIQQWLDENKKNEQSGEKPTEEPKGLYPKYKIVKMDGTATDPNAQYFTVRIDTDPHARAAVRAYIESCREENQELARDLEEVLKEVSGD